MKSTVEQLTPSDKKALALLFGTDAHKALKKLCQFEIDGVAKDALAANDMSQVNFAKGQAFMAKKLPSLMETIYKESDKKG